MANNRLETTLEAINGGQNWAILTGKSNGYPYENGKRVSDTPNHMKITIALQGNSLTPLTVKIEGGTDPLANVSVEKIATACSSLKFIPVQFTDCKVTLYSIDGQMVMSAIASGVELVNLNK